MVFTNSYLKYLNKSVTQFPAGWTAGGTKSENLCNRIQFQLQIQLQMKPDHLSYLPLLEIKGEEIVIGVKPTKTKPMKILPVQYRKKLCFQTDSRNRLTVLPI